jgi:hypothetical protein
MKRETVFATLPVIYLCAAFAAACASAPTAAIPSAPLCLPVPAYSSAQQAALAQEWTALAHEHPAWVTVQAFIPDAVRLRDAARAACK